MLYLFKVAELSTLAGNCRVAVNNTMTIEDITEAIVILIRVVVVVGSCGYSKDDKKKKQLKHKQH